MTYFAMCEEKEEIAVEVRLYASLQEHVTGYEGGKPLSLSLIEGSDVSDVLKRLNIPPETTKLIVINGRQSSVETALADGDRLALFPPVAGG